MRKILGSIILALAITGCAGRNGGDFSAGAAPFSGPGPAFAPGDRHGPGRPGGPGPRLFLSPMGEPFRAASAADGEELWFRGADTDKDGFLSRAELVADALRFHATLDTNHDGEIDPAEMTRYETEIAPEVRAGGGPGGAMGGGGRAGGREGGMGRGGHGGGGRGGGMGGGPGSGGPPGGGEGPSGGEKRPRGMGAAMKQGAARFSFLDIPQPVIAADSDFNRGVSRQEFARAAGERFSMLDAGHHGRIAFAELPALPAAHSRP